MGCERAVLVEIAEAMNLERGDEKEQNLLNSVVDLDIMLVNTEYLTDRPHSFFEVRF